MTTRDWDEQAAMLRDDGYDGVEIREILGDRPIPPPMRRSHRRVLVPAGPVIPEEALREPAPELPRPRPQSPVEVAPGEPPVVLKTLEELAASFAEDTAVDTAPLRPAVGLHRVQLSRSEKRLRIAKAMCVLRGGTWHRLDDAKRQALMTLADFALQAVEEVERQEIELGKPRSMRGPRPERNGA